MEPRDRRRRTLSFAAGALLGVTFGWLTVTTLRSRTASIDPPTTQHAREISWLQDLDASSELSTQVASPYHAVEEKWRREVERTAGLSTEVARPYGASRAPISLPPAMPDPPMTTSLGINMSDNSAIITSMTNQPTNAPNMSTLPPNITYAPTWSHTGNKYVDDYVNTIIPLYRTYKAWENITNYILTMCETLLKQIGDTQSEVARVGHYYEKITVYNPLTPWEAVQAYLEGHEEANPAQVKRHLHQVLIRDGAGAEPQQ